MRYTIVLLVMFILTGCCKNELTEIYYQRENVIVKNERLAGDSLYSFELLNEGNVDEDCWATLEIVSEGKVINRITKYGGIIKPNESTALEIKIDDMPGGLSYLPIILNCTSVK